MKKNRRIIHLRRKNRIYYINDMNIRKVFDILNDKIDIETKSSIDLIMMRRHNPDKVRNSIFLAGQRKRIGNE